MLAVPRLRPRLLSALLAALSAAAGGAFADSPAPPATPVTVEELRREPPPAETDATSLRFLETYLQALGGAELVAGTTTLRREGTIREGRSEVTVIEYISLPNRIRRETKWRDSGRDHHEITATDGTTGWKWVVKPRPQQAVELGAGDLNRLIAEADLFGPLVHGPERGWKFAYRGPARSRTRPGFLVLGWSPAGPQQWFYFDAETYLCTRVGSRESFAGQQADADRYNVRYVRAGGLWWPAEVEYETSSRVYRREVWTRIEPGLTFEDTLFRPPPTREIILRSRPTSQ